MLFEQTCLTSETICQERFIAEVTKQWLTTKQKKDHWNTQGHARFIAKRNNGKQTRLPCSVQSWLFFGHRPKRFWIVRKKLSHFGQNVEKYRPMNTVTATFNTTVRQMTELFHWPKCLSKKMTEMSQRKKKQVQGYSKQGKTSKNYTCFTLRRFEFLIHLQSKKFSADQRP